MSYHKSGSDLLFCAHCDAILHLHEDVLCGPCAQAVIDAWDEPSDAELAQRDALIARGWQRLAAVLAGATLAAALITGIGAHLTHEARAQDAGLSRVVDGRTITWPVIGTPGYSASCEIVQAWEDGSAIATCREDGAVMAFDPDGSDTRDPQTWYKVETTR